jgi:hypothetical protein
VLLDGTYTLRPVVSAKPRVAVALTPATESEFVALVATLAGLDVLDRCDLVVPALDVEATKARVSSLLEDPAVAHVEPIHAYVESGHTRAVLVGADPATRGHSVATLVRALLSGDERPSTTAVAPSSVVAWLASSWQLDVPEPLRNNGVVLPPAEREQIVGEAADPAAAHFIERFVRPRDTAVEVGPINGVLTVHLARAVGPLGHVATIARPADSARLRDCFALNGVSAWTTIHEAHDAAEIASVLAGLPHIDVVCIDDGRLDCASLAGAAGALVGGRVRTLLVRVVPRSLRGEPGQSDPVRELFCALRERAGATFALVGWDGEIHPTTAKEVLEADDALLLAAEMNTSS